MTFNKSEITASYKLVGNSKDCDCNLENFECFSEKTKSGHTPVVAMAKYTLTPKKNKDKQSEAQRLEWRTKLTE
jgi:hypothetical protein